MLALLGDLRGAAEAQKQRYSPEDPSTLEQIRNLKHGCCIVMLRYSSVGRLPCSHQVLCDFLPCKHFLLRSASASLIRGISSSTLPSQNRSFANDLYFPCQSVILACWCTSAVAQARINCKTAGKQRQLLWVWTLASRQKTL